MASVLNYLKEICIRPVELDEDRWEKLLRDILKKFNYGLNSSIDYYFEHITTLQIQPNDNINKIKSISPPSISQRQNINFQPNWDANNQDQNIYEDESILYYEELFDNEIKSSSTVNNTLSSSDYTSKNNSKSHSPSPFHNTIQNVLHDLPSDTNKSPRFTSIYPLILSDIPLISSPSSNLNSSSYSKFPHHANLSSVSRIDSDSPNKRPKLQLNKNIIPSPGPTPLNQLASLHQQGYYRHLPFNEPSDQWPKLLASIIVPAESTTRGRNVFYFGDKLYFISSFHQNNNKRPLPSKEDKILRFDKNPESYFGLGRLPVELSQLLSHLYNQDLIVLKGKVIACPEKLEIFSTIDIQLDILIRHDLFHPRDNINQNNDVNYINIQFCQLLIFLDLKPLISNADNISLSKIYQKNKISSINSGLKSYLPSYSGSLSQSQSSLKEVQSGLDDSFQSEELSSDFAKKLLPYNNVIDLPSIEQPSGLFCQLRPYQCQGLKWMIEREYKEDQDGVSSPHPLYDQYSFNDSNSTSFYVNHFCFDIQINPPTRNKAYGGILADEMGLGKTIQIIALLVHENQQHNNQKSNKTLVICPMSIVGQWEEEIQTHSDLKVLVYYSKSRSLTSLSSTQFNIIITTYGVLAHEYNKGDYGDNLLFNTFFHRIVLDEGHIIKNRTTDVAKACFTLKGQYRWVLTGTPLQNHLEDIFSLLCFLREDPWCMWNWWSLLIATPFAAQDDRSLQRLHVALKPLILRRTKDMKDQLGRPILELPLIQEDILKLDFSKEERDFYSALFNHSSADFFGLLSKGKVLHQYAHILELLLRLRQVCDHPILVMNQKFINSDDEKIEKIISKFVRYLQNDSNLDKFTFYSQVAQDMKEGKIYEQECPICLDQINNPTLLSCGHIFCLECFHLLNPHSNANPSSSLCPLCRNEIDLSNVTLIPMPTPPIDQNQPTINDLKKRWVHSTKTQQLLNEIINIHSKNIDEKIVVFSQWTQMLNIIEIMLNQDNFKDQYLRFDGSLDRNQRDQIMKEFSTSSTKFILLISLKAGGVGLNLTRANHCLFMDGWWNPAVERQAIQRIHRIGQNREVFVKRFIIKNTIEERLEELKKKKNLLVDDIMSNLDEKENKIEDLRQLFINY